MQFDREISLKVQNPIDIGTILRLYIPSNGLWVYGRVTSYNADDGIAVLGIYTEDAQKKIRTLDMMALMK